MAASIHLFDQVGVTVLGTGTEYETLSARPVSRRCTIPENLLNDGQYGVTAFLLREGLIIDVSVADAICFTVHDNGETRGSYMGKIIGVVRPLSPGQ